MNSKTILIILFSIALIMCLSCSNRSDQPESDKDMVASIEKGRSLPSQKPMRMENRRYGQGQGRGLGRRAGRPWQLTDVIHLNPDEETAIEIQTAEVLLKPMRGQLDAMGKVLEHQHRKAIVSYAFSARISERHVKLGDWVAKGQELITLQSEEVGTAKSEFYKAKADHELARVNHERVKRLFDRGVGAKKDLLATEAELKVAETSLNAAEKKLHVLGFNEDQVRAIDETHQINPVITLYAPISGKIVTDNAVLGAMIDQASEILVLLDPRVLNIDAEIYEKDIAKIKTGQDVEARVPAYPGEIFKGKISYISDILKEETRTITVRCEVENHRLKLKPGMFADMRIFLNHRSNVLVVPRNAVLDDKNDKIVFIKQDDHYIPVIVEVGHQENDHIEITKGLQEGDMVVIKGNFQLKSRLYDGTLGAGHVH